MRANDEYSHDLALPTRDKAKPGRARSFGMFAASLHRKNLADAKAPLLSATGKDDSALKDQATNLVAVGVDFADLVGLHIPVPDLAKAVSAQFGFKARCMHSALHGRQACPIRHGDHSTIAVLPVSRSKYSGSARLRSRRR